MQDLTFGEQVKIILSRKDMTIKELARKIERRTGKKMSRQNLTQRLGRDNFQEQDMRMIAEILDCPFYLNILEDSIPAEKTENETEVRPKAEVLEELKADTKHAQCEPEKESDDGREDKLSEKGAEAGSISDEDGEKPGESAASDEDGEKPGESIASDEDTQKPEEAGAPNGMANERDITIGELVDIHKKLDVLENSVGKGTDPHGNEADSDGQADGQADERHSDSAKSALYEEQTDQEYGAGQEDHGEQNGQEQTEYPEFREEYAGEMSDTPVEKILEEIESLEIPEKKEEKQEEKPHGWRAYFKHRFKKRGKDHTVIREEPHAAGDSGTISRSTDETADSANPGTGTAYGTASADGYEASRGEYGGTDHTGEYENEYAEAGYAGEYGNEYAEAGYAGEYENEYAETGYAGEYRETYAEGSYSDEAWEEQSVDYAAEAEYGYGQEQQEEPLPEEDTVQGEMNPYTGKEYESNSVRMHPSRIGYVQVYDRENHQWTDMTEWAFLGYQERKKQLLGKDYDPPIYLD